MERYGKKSLAEKVKNKLKFFVKRNRKIEIKQSIEKYDLKFLYAIPVLAIAGFLMDKYFLIKSNGLYAFVPFSFTIFLANKGIVKFSRSKELKRLNMFRVLDEVRF